MFDRDKFKIGVDGIRENKPDGKLGTFWTRGGVILIDDETITLQYLGTMGIFNRKTVRYYRDRDEELLFKRVLRICDDTQDFSVTMYPSAFDKFMKAMKNCN